MNSSKIIMDLDGTITIDSSTTNYSSKQPNKDVVDRMRQYRAKGFKIVIATSRNMRTYKGNVGEINVKTLPTILEWLAEHDIPYDEIIVGKPWCGPGGFYVDDRSIRPDEFVALNYDDINATLTQQEG